MERHGKNNGWTAVPEFGEWDQKGRTSPNYSMVFGQARASRKQAKKSVKHLSLGHESDWVPRHHHHHRKHQDDDAVVLKQSKFLSYINCCIRPY